MKSRRTTQEVEYLYNGVRAGLQKRYLVNNEPKLTPTIRCVASCGPRVIHGFVNYGQIGKVTGHIFECSICKAQRIYGN
jgi:hypothetical protein